MIYRNRKSGPQKRRCFYANCKYCGQNVFILQNHDAQTWVIFDHPGDDWPKHNCAEYRLALSRAGMISHRHKTVKVFDQPPYAAELQELVCCGSVVHEKPVKDLFSHLGCPRNAVASSLLKSMLGEQYLELMVYATTDEELTFDSFTFLIPRSLLKGVRSRKQSEVFVRLQSFPVYCHNELSYIWVCKELIC